MDIHPKIKDYISAVGAIGKISSSKKQDEVLKTLKTTGATSTEATVVLHQGFNFTTEEAEKIINSSGLWEREDIEDIAYQTFLYVSYRSK